MKNMGFFYFTEQTIKLTLQIYALVDNFAYTALYRRYKLISKSILRFPKIQACRSALNLVYWWPCALLSLNFRVVSARAVGKPSKGPWPLRLNCAVHSSDLQCFVLGIDSNMLKDKSAEQHGHYAEVTTLVLTTPGTPT